MRILGSALILLCASIVVVYANANEADEPDIRRGQFDITFTPAQLLDAETLASVAEFVDADEEITWKMHVPESYDPAKPAGLMVYISPSDKGYMPRGWQPVIDDQNFIWIGADEAGNETRVGRRMLFAVLGTQLAALDYRIDDDRVYLSGFSGGGKVSGLVAIHFSNKFKGAIYICGAEFWDQSPPPLFEQVETNRYVFLSGSNDFNLDLTKKIYRSYKGAGLSQIKLIVVPRMAHSNPNTKYFRQAVNFLDERE
jgi:predicted esterase